jgi:GntR family transcriptional regulator
LYRVRTILVTVDPSESTPLYLQIAAQVRASIGSGRLSAGDRLPTARELGEALGVNLHTVLRAYAALRDEGLVEMRRRRGVIVCGAVDGRARVIALARDLAAEGRRQGLSDPELLQLVKESL